ncbi:TPA: hypothetical protein K8N36_003163 [Clostridium perfringens]|uniref:hypothetical protein n=1 Tax=Bacillota TaxID=1239 RepID=UPI00016BD5B6|nr:MULTISPECIES: hypothetical protein [Bacillota]MDU4264720.1 hypothetical protein [Bifidobacterium breve]EDT25482.1 conserved hypothetical protein [Clostridium perfringens CPE str. F4969]EGT0682101.1 hypothetical protein [Clostridium perfringens]EGT0684795.1 hypothetical protein [Clostridium perfringens]EGT0687623.1 hypothetical protein [Clostridium perfringens]
MATSCEISLIQAALDDLDLLPDEVFEEYLQMEEKLKKNIHLGQALKNKNNKNLSNCFKLYFNNAKYRIVYLKKNNVCQVLGVSATNTKVAEIIAVGKRDKEEVYQNAYDRLMNK